MRLKITYVLIGLCLSLVLSGCSTTPEKETSYYLLNNHQSIADVEPLIEKNIVEIKKVERAKAQNPEKLSYVKANVSQDDKNTIVIDLKELSQYLNQPYLVMQLNPHQLHYARLHMWAEPLQDGINKALLFDLNNQTKYFQFINHAQNIHHIGQKLHIQIEYFHASKDSKVTLSGRFWLETMQNKLVEKSLYEKALQEKRVPFYFEEKLKQDGYPHSVTQMRMLLSLLSKEVISHLTQ